MGLGCAMGSEAARHQLDVVFILLSRRGGFLGRRRGIGAHRGVGWRRKTGATLRHDLVLSWGLVRLTRPRFPADGDGNSVGFMSSDFPIAGDRVPVAVIMACAWEAALELEAPVEVRQDHDGGHHNQDDADLGGVAQAVPVRANGQGQLFGSILLDLGHPLRRLESCRCRDGHGEIWTYQSWLSSRGATSLRARRPV